MEKFFDDFEDLIKRMEIKFIRSKKEGIATENENFVICPYCKKLIDFPHDAVYTICYGFEHIKVTKQDLKKWENQNHNIELP
jgi:hypothetical protein